MSSTPSPASSTRPRRATLLAVLAALAALGTACSNLKEGGDEPGAPAAVPDGAAPAPDGAPPPAPTGSTPSPVDGSTPVGVGPTGPGPFGALPNGYCCTDETQCRSRQCLDGPGGKMCRDRCSTADGCLATAGAFTCEATGADPRERLCAPKAGTQCIPGAQFARGAKKLGDCCTATHDANAGLECEGGSCASFGAAGNPYICYQACSKPSDCPGPYMCAFGSYDFKICVPESGQSLTCR